MIIARLLLLSALAIGLSSATTTAVTTLACQSITVTPASGSICPTQTWSICSTAAGAQLTQSALQAAWSALTTATTTATGTVACSAVGGTPVDSFWTSPSTWHCDSNPNPCDSSSCGQTATSPPATSQPYCCSTLRSRVSSACNNVPNLDTLITPTSMGNGTSTILGALGLPSTCADTNCMSVASSTAVVSAFASLLLAVIAAMIM